MKQPAHFSQALLVLHLPLLMWTQTFTGRVIDESTSNPLAYVNIGALYGQRGTVSDEQGFFDLSLDALDPDAVIRFSFIGYEPRDLKVVETNPLTPMTVALKPKVLEMQEVLVFPLAYKDKIVGNPNTPKLIRAGFGHDSRGYELGILVRIKKKPTLLKELSLHKLSMSYDSVFYRLNVYELKEGVPGENILREPIYISLGKQNLTDEVRIDLGIHHIVVQDDFVVTLEYVRELGEGSLDFGAGFLNGKTFYRKTSQSVWRSAPIGIGMSVLIRYPQ